jgi:DNA-binding GntR family transcriptional regulator
MKLAERVYEDLSSRIESQEPLPCKLTFSALAKHYQVSLTPVRTAVKQLVSEGYLVTLDNGRLQVNDEPPAKRRTRKVLPLEPPKDYEAIIQADIIRMSLVGDSRYIREAAAAAKYNIGRTVLRPIFSRLAGKGLLEHVPRCGWRVRTFDKNDLTDFVEMRETLELKALEKARPKLKKEVLQQFLAGNRSQGDMQMGALNNNLHSYWIKLSGNRYIIDFFERQALYYTTLFDYAAPEAHVVAEMAGQHCEILEALIDDRWTEARKALVRHIRDQKPIV